MTIKRSYRLAALFSHPIQYFAPLLRHVAARPEIDLTVYFCSRKGLEEYADPGFGQSVKWDIRLLDGYSSQFLPNVGKGKGSLSLLNPGIVKELLQKQYDAIWVHGYMHATNWLAFLAGRVTGTPILLRAESNLLSPRPWWVRMVKGVALRLLFSQVAAFLYIGTRNQEYYEHYGVPEQRLFFTPYCVDNTYLQMQAERFQPRREELRKAFGIFDDRPVIMQCGKLIPKKQPLMLLEAFAEVRQHLPCALLYVGDGVLRSEIEGQIARRNIPDVRVTGFLNQSDVPKAYIAADMLVLPSTWKGRGAETWGLVVNEGMSFGLPVVVTDQVGCASDLVREGENGYVVPYDDVGKLAEALEMLVSHSERRKAYGSKSLELIQEWSFDACANGILRALSQTCV